MRTDLGTENEAWRAEIRAFLDAELPADHAFNPEFDDAPEQWAIAVEFSKKVAAKGWIGLTWPKEYGGKGLTPVANQIFLEEMYAADAPIINSVGIFLAAGTILVGGSEEQKQRLLPEIASMNTLWAEGLTEPEAGSDLGSLKTKAVQDGDDWIITGQKAFTSWGPMSDVLYVAARTGAEDGRNDAISIFLVDLKSEGVTLHPMRNYGGGVQSTTYLDHVRVSSSSLIGEAGMGWKYIMRAFYASGTVEPIYAMQESRLRELVAYCKQIPGKLEDPRVQADLAELAGIVQSQRLMAYEIIGDNAAGRQTPWGGGVQQIAAKEYEPLFAQIFDRVLGPTSQLRSDSKLAPMGGKPEAWYRQSFANHAGGTSQLKRMVLATRGLGLSR
ncbi:alkylation response protein AidB-like acyl-CoA dehydrogenase [Leucobacter exalbidus]|uniref:Alkylation response protein AidB-like acyl-CoA dehydrogenase n=1 Tax=Leucobacter exalbidus TaxID=662960 RepID=A0A940T0K2_9MICO|nr:acyl-CoA dehydrogenase family protein [Leucobacter exalbidus]MBP1325980.1 alkylation response protein AidB-like acyl-CoA dehydrogenase [Leucobacter exalbidus]